MPQGYYTIEQWIKPKSGALPKWVEVLQLPAGTSLTEAESAVQSLAKPGLYRLLQMQRVIWAERDGREILVRKSHALSPQGLDGIRQMYERSGGRYPLEEVKETRRLAKLRKGGK